MSSSGEGITINQLAHLTRYLRILVRGCGTNTARYGANAPLPHYYPSIESSYSLSSIRGYSSNIGNAQAPATITIRATITFQ